MENKNLLLFPVLIPTKDASPLFIQGGELLQDFIKEVSIGGEQHLYLCSTLPVKEGDWMIDRNYGKPSQLKDGKGFEPYLKNQCKKILFTTDLKLIADGVLEIDGNTKGRIKNLVTIDREYLLVNFLSEYCNRYNQKDNQNHHEVNPSRTETNYCKCGRPIDSLIHQKGVDVEKLADEFRQKGSIIKHSDPHTNVFESGIYQGFKAGYKANTGRFSLEDMEKAYAVGVSDGDNPNVNFLGRSVAFEDLLQSLTKEQLKGDIIIECEMEKYNWHYPANEPDSGEWDYKMKLDNGQPILIFK